MRAMADCEPAACQLFRWDCALFEAERSRQMHQHLFGANLQEVLLLDVPMLQDIRNAAAACLVKVHLQKTKQLVKINRSLSNLQVV